MNNAVLETEKLIEKYDMICEGDVVIAGVSGGADSVCLLFVLYELQEKLRFQLKVCHVNHCLRGEAADRDEAYVKKLCETMGVEYRIFREDVKLIAKNRKQSTEEAGRFVRREAFEKMCLEAINNGEKQVKIATAHHKDDNAETMILNIARGTGLKGLRGIMPKQGKWIHPLLALTRKQIEEYLKENHLSWKEDATNEEDDYTRNRIRHTIIPAMTSMVNEQTVSHLEELSAQAEEIWNYLEFSTQQAWERCVTVSKHSADHGHITSEETVYMIRKDSFETLFPAVQKQLIRMCIATIRNEEKDITALHVKSVLELFQKQVGRQIHLPGNFVARRDYDGVVLKKVMERKTVMQTELALNVPDSQLFFQEYSGKTYKIESCFVEGKDKDIALGIPQKSYTKWFDYDIIEHRLCVRTRRQGDYIAIDGSGKRQKLKSWFINEKIPKELRDTMLLIADGNHIMWIPGYRMSSAYQVSEETGKIVEIKITEENEHGRDN